MKVVAIIQARMGSIRLPKKVLKYLGSKSVLDWVVLAAKNIPGVDDVVVATSTTENDDEIEKWCVTQKIKVFRGSEIDVLDRFDKAARDIEADVIVRLTGDCPFLDPQVCGTVLSLYKLTNADYASNCSPANWPDGLDCEVFSAECLSEANLEASSLVEREHVTPFIQYNRYRYSIHTLSCPLPHLHKERWTLDAPEDLRFLRKIASKIVNDRPPSYLEILKVLEEFPDFRSINNLIGRNEGLQQTVSVEGNINRGYAASQSLLNRALKSIPLGSQTFSKSYIQYPKNAPMFLTFGDGGSVWGRRWKCLCRPGNGLAAKCIRLSRPGCRYSNRKAA